jgi:flavin reductase (DIM6/NTAB) family NADH-FMN oxidoreductase RutF
MPFRIIFMGLADIAKKLVPRNLLISRLPSPVVPITARQHARPILMFVSEYLSNTRAPI